MPPGGDDHRQVAKLLADAERRPDRDHDVLVTDPGSAAWGRLAAALAVGAHLAVGNGVAWNTLADRGARDDRVLLERDWGITDAEGWREQMDALLDAQNSDPAIQMVLDRRGRGTGERAWREAIAAWCREHDISDETVRQVVELSGQILRYEARFRADGLLPPDGRVESVYGYDFGRAVNMARWGLNAGYCDAEEAEKCVLTAGHRANQVYPSWGRSRRGTSSAGCCGSTRASSASGTSARSPPPHPLRGPRQPVAAHGLGLTAPPPVSRGRRCRR